MTVPLSAICFPTRLIRSLREADIHTVDDLRATVPARLGQIPGIGTASLKIILEVIDVKSGRAN